MDPDSTGDVEDRPEAYSLLPNGVCVGTAGIDVSRALAETTDSLDVGCAETDLIAVDARRPSTAAFRVIYSYLMAR